MHKLQIYDDQIGEVSLIDFMGSDLTIVNSARVSFAKHKSVMNKDDEKLIKYLIDHNHTSPFEHCVATFRFVVPLFVRSQHHRHRTWSFNEISRRYTEENIQFYEPSAFRTQAKSNRQASNANELIDPEVGFDGKILTASQAVKDFNSLALTLYDNLLKAKVSREQARGILPQNLYTQYYGTCDLHNIMKFISLRDHAGAQWEIQKVAQAIETICTDLWPVAVKAFKDRKHS